ncbi:IS4 family transposase [Phormidesmis sp. 146-33]
MGDAAMGAVELGDSRRNERAVALGAAIARNPSGSLPEQMQGWNELRGAYRLLSEADVSHERLSRPHWEQTRAVAQGQESEVVLFIQDTSELDYSHHPKTSGMGIIGKGQTQGLLVHSCLAVIPRSGNPEILGLARQQVWARSATAQHQGSGSKRTVERSEGDKWAESLEAIGRAPTGGGQRWVSVGDRESDVFSYLRRSAQSQWQSLVRVSQNRVITTASGTRSHLKAYARSLSAQSQKTVNLRGREGTPQRSVPLNLAWAAVTIHAPQGGPERQAAPVSGWCIRCWEEAPDGLEWILLTTVDPALYSPQVQVEWYACRWLIEAYHKCLKTGCRMEQRQLESASGLMRLLGFIAIGSVRLLQMRTLSRLAPETPADQEIPAVLLQVLATRLGLFSAQMSLAQFWQAVARLGGFIGRKSDGQPGWLTLWRGWLRLQDLAWGVQLPS